MSWKRQGPPGLNGLERLRQGPDVVVGEPQGLDLGQLRLVRKGGQDQAELLQGAVQHLHPVALTVIGLGPSLKKNQIIC